MTSRVIIFTISCLLILATGAQAATILDLDANDLALANGQTVNTWGPAIGSGTPTFLTNQTPNGSAAVEFNGGDHFGILAAALFPASGTGDFIVAGVIKATNTGAYHNIIDDDAGNRPMLWIDPAFRYELNFGGGGGARAAGTGVNGWDVFIANSRTNQLFINSPTANASGGSAIPYNVAEHFDLFNRDGGQLFQGLVAELRVYNDAAMFGNDYAALFNELNSKLLPLAPAAVPIPATLPLVAAGLGLLGLLRLRRNRRTA